MNLVVRVRGTAPGRCLVFNGRLDTFPLVNAKQSSVDFNGEERDGKSFGLGVSDMKGGLAAIIFALRHLSRHRESFAGEVAPRLPATKKAWGPRAADIFSHVPHALGDAMISADTGSPHVLRFGEKGMIWLRNVTITAQSYHSLAELAARSKLITIVDEIAALSARAQGLRVVPLAPLISIPVVASIAINGERSALVEQFVETCRETLGWLK
jgi:succinyl-diaminopimelate desuccinylase